MCGGLLLLCIWFCFFCCLVVFVFVPGVCSLAFCLFVLFFYFVCLGFFLLLSVGLGVCFVSLQNDIKAGKENLL